MAELYNDIGDKSIADAALTQNEELYEFQRLAPTIVSYLDGSNVQQVCLIPVQSAFLWTTDASTSRTNADVHLNMSGLRYVVLFLDSEKADPQLYAVSEVDYSTVKISFDVVPLYYLYYGKWEYFQIKQEIPKSFNVVVYSAGLAQIGEDSQISRSITTHKLKGSLGTIRGSAYNDENQTVDGLPFADTDVIIGGPTPATGNYIGADRKGNVVVIALGNLLLMNPAGAAQEATDITATLGNAPGTIPDWNEISAKAIACDGTTWWVLAIFVNSQDNYVANVEEYVLQSNDLINWTVLRDIGGYGGRAGPVVDTFVDAVFSGIYLNGLNVTGAARFSDGTFQTWNSVFAPLSSTAPSPQHLYGNHDGSLSFDSGDVLIGTITLSMPPPTQNIPDPRTGGELGDVLIGTVLSGDYIGPITSIYSSFNPLTLALGQEFSGTNGIDGEPTVPWNAFGFNVILISPFVFEPEVSIFLTYQAFTDPGGILTANGIGATPLPMPAGWIKVVLALEQSFSQQTLEILSEDFMTTIASTLWNRVGGVFSWGGQSFYFPIHLCTLYEVNIDCESVNIYDYTGLNVGVGGTVIIAPVSGEGTALIAYGSNAPIPLDTIGQEVYNYNFIVTSDHGQNTGTTFMRFSSDNPAYLWCSSDDMKSTGFIDPTTGKGDKSLQPTQGVCGDGAGGLYTINFANGALYHRLGAAGSPWRLVSDANALIPELQVVSLLAVSQKKLGNLICVHGQPPLPINIQGQYGVNEAFVVVHDPNAIVSTVTYFNITTHTVINDTAFSTPYMGMNTAHLQSGSNFFNDTFCTGAVEVWDSSTNPNTPIPPIIPGSTIVVDDETGDTIISDGSSLTIVNG